MREKTLDSHCVVCNQKITYTRIRKDGRVFKSSANHHCDPALIAKIENGRKGSGQVRPLDSGKTFSDRIADAHEMILGE